MDCGGYGVGVRAGAEGSAGASFKVTETKKEVVTALDPLQEHWLPLSNLDLLLPPLDVGVFFCYWKSPPPAGSTSSSSSSSFGSMVGVLKKAMAQVLVSYYVLAGEVLPNSAGEPALLCNNRGVDFLEAFADIELKDINLYNPDQSIEGKLVPKKKDGVLAIQATELKCGGVVVACSFDHRVADAYSANMFLVSWAETARSKPMSVLPSFRRSLLNPRRPGCVDPALDDMYVPISKLPPPPKSEKEDDLHQLASRIYYVKADDLNQLQLLASSNAKRTKLESFSAFLWQMVAKSAIDSRDTRKKSTSTIMSKMGIVVDGRTRMTMMEEKNSSPDTKATMSAYFGNVLSIPFSGRRVDELTEKPLSWVAEEVHNFLERAVTKEHFLGLIDWVEAHRPEPAMTKIYSSRNEDGPSFVVSSGQRFQVSKVDFGWGEPAFGSYHFPWGGSTGYVMPMPSPAGDEDWIVYMHLQRRQLELIEKEAYNFFRPLTSHYLKLVPSSSDKTSLIQDDDDLRVT